MDAWDAIRARRAVRSFSDQPIEAKDLDQILEAGRRAPSSMNEQRWDFVVVTGRPQLEHLSEVWQYGKHVARSAATIALVTPRTEDPHLQASIAFDLGQAAMSIMIAAAALGIGSCHSSVQDQDLARNLLGYPDDRECGYLIALGYPADQPLRAIRIPKRRPFDDVVHPDDWEGGRTSR
jgi:nitroreductase